MRKFGRRSKPKESPAQTPTTAGSSGVLKFSQISQPVDDDELEILEDEDLDQPQELHQEQQDVEEQDEEQEEQEELDYFTDQGSRNAQPSLPGVVQMSGPRKWEDVDTEELTRSALSICSNAVPSVEHAEAASRLAMQAAALDADTMDPLGLGRIEMRTMQLLPADKAPKVSRLQRYGSVTAQMHTTRRPSMDRPGEREAARGGPGSITDPTQLAALRRTVLPTSEGFDAAVYLAVIHSQSALEELEAGQEALQVAGSERTDQLKALVKQNFERFISCKTTIDDVHVRLKGAEIGGRGASGGASTEDVKKAVEAAQKEARHVFNDVLTRAAESERIKGSLAMLRQYGSLFRLPARIRSATAHSEYQQVVAEYKTARALMQSMGSSTGVWASLLQEVDRAVAGMAAQLEPRLKVASTQLQDAGEAMAILLQLQADGAPCAAQAQPIQLFLETLQGGAQQAMGACVNAHEAALQGLLQRAECDAAAREGGPGLDRSMFRRLLVKQPGWATQPQEAASQQLPQNIAGSEPLWADHVARLTAVLSRCLPPFWQLGQIRFASLAGISREAAQAVEAARSQQARAVASLLAQYREHAWAGLRELAKPGADKALFLTTVRKIVSGFAAMRASGGGPTLDQALLQVLEAASAQATAQMVAERVDLVERLAEVEDWHILPLGGAFISAVPGRLKEVVDSGMAQMAALHAEVLRLAPGEAGPVSPLGGSVTALRLAFHDAFTMFAIAAQTLAEAAGEASPGSPGGPTISPTRRLLVLMSNCQHVRCTLLPALADKYQQLLRSDQEAQGAADLQADSCAQIKQVEESLAKQFQQVKAQQVRGALQAWLAPKGLLQATALPQGLRDVALEFSTALVEVAAEVHEGAPEQGDEVMSHMLTQLLTEAADMLLVPGVLEGAGVGGSLQLLVELQYLEAAMPAALSFPAASEALDHLKDIMSQLLEAHANSRGRGAGSLSDWGASERRPSGSLMQAVLAKGEAMAVQAAAASELNTACFSDPSA